MIYSVVLDFSGRSALNLAMSLSEKWKNLSPKLKFIL